jgi:hypothetical protein
VHYWHAGYFFDHDEAFVSIKRLLQEGWTVVAVLPQLREGYGFSIVVQHPTETVPSWERA